VTLDFLGEDTSDAGAGRGDGGGVQVDVLVRAVGEGAGLGHAEVSVKLSAIGQFLPVDVAPEGGHRVALENARDICRAARNAGTTVTLDMEDHTTTDSTLAILRELRKDFPETGAVLQAMPAPHRGRLPCAGLRGLAGAAVQGRLHAQPEAVAFQDAGRRSTSSYVRCLKVLLAGQGYPMVATHDPRMVEIATSLAGPLRRAGRGPTSSRCSTACGPTSRSRLAAATASGAGLRALRHRSGTAI
jgi:proline dehydrogenase